MARSPRSAVSKPSASVRTVPEPTAAQVPPESVAPAMSVAAGIPDVPDMLAPWMSLWSRQLEMWMAGWSEAIERQQAFWAQWVELQQGWQRQWQPDVAPAAPAAPEPSLATSALVPATAWFEQAQSTMQAFTQQWADAWHSAVPTVRH